MKVNAQFPANKKGEKSTADQVTVQVAEYVSRMGITRSSITRGTGLPDGILRRSLTRRERSLRADELLKICRFLEKDPFDFMESAPQTL